MSDPSPIKGLTNAEIADRLEEFARLLRSTGHPAPTTPPSAAPPKRHAPKILGRPTPSGPLTEPPTGTGVVAAAHIATSHQTNVTRRAADNPGGYL